MTNPVQVNQVTCEFIVNCVFKYKSVRASIWAGRGHDHEIVNEIVLSSEISYHAKIHPFAFP